MADFFIQTAFLFLMVYLTGVYPAFVYFQLKSGRFGQFAGIFEDFLAAWKWPVFVLDWAHDKSR